MKILQQLSFSLSTFLIAILAEASTESKAWVVADSNSISYRIGEQVLWTYNHAKEEGKPYFHPLANTTGTVFSDLRPKDHPWHRGLWFSWKYINSVNYWEEDRETGLSKGKTIIDSVERRISQDKTVTVSLKISYAPSADAPAVMKEFRTIAITPPDEKGAYSIDWESEYTAFDQDLLLDRTPIPSEPNGKEYGGYAGLSLRMTQGLRSGVYRSSEGLEGKAAKSQPARWMSFTPATGSSVVFMDHPSNLSYPTRWYLGLGMNYFSPAVLYNKPHELKAHQKLSLKYKFLISSKTLSSTEIESNWKDWSQSR